MLRLLSVFCVVVAFALSAVKVSAATDPADHGPPYTSADFLALSGSRVPTEMRKTLPEWWARAPEYLRKRILGAPSDMWWSIILCNYMGFKPEGMDAGGAEKCEKDSYKASQRGKNFWTADGQWVGPSEECRKRNKTTQYGELICD